MSIIIQFPQKLDPSLRNLVDFANNVDADVHAAYQTGADLPDIAGVLANRLGEVLRLIKGKERLWDVCQEITEKRAGL